MAKKLFTLAEAEALMPEVRDLTARAVARMNELAAAIEALPNATPEREAMVRKAKLTVETWAEAVDALGAEVKGLWLVDFDSGEGYYCWQHPEPTLDYFHTYEAGFGGRELIRPAVLH